MVSQLNVRSACTEMEEQDNHWAVAVFMCAGDPNLACKRASTQRR